MTVPKKLTGLFLGAGASYEAGMPLVWDLTTELTRWLTPEKLRTLNGSWRSQGGGHPDEVIEDFASVIARPDLHYENMLGYLETQFRRHSSPSQEYHALYSWLVEMVYFILYYRHANNGEYIRRSLDFYSGLATLATQNRPLWVFSLNHDLIVECLAAALNLPLNSGFTDERVSFPRRDSEGQLIGHLEAEVLPGDVLENSAMPFLQHGQNGLNLLKIHGALDVFAFRDGKDLLKLLPLGDGVDGVLAALRSANEELVYKHAMAPGQAVKTTNEITYADETGEMQFLRRSLLAGAYKFDKRRSQVIPLRLLDHFRSNINHVTKLICVGYGFGDAHINAIMRDWLEFTGDRRLVIVGPGVTTVPATFLHVAPQVELHALTATEYLDASAGIVRSKREATEKRLADWIRRNGDTAKSEMGAFLRDHQRRKIESFVDWIKTLPIRDGDIDVSALGVSVDELIQEGTQRFAELPEDVLEEFLTSRKPKTSSGS
jgi:hypothetical protein